MSFIYISIYWNNHHHFFHLVRHVDGVILWANLHLLFWLSLVPFATGWMGENHFAPLPTAIYGVSLLFPALAWYGLQRALIRAQGDDSPLARALGRDVKGKISPSSMSAASRWPFSTRASLRQSMCLSRCSGSFPTVASRESSSGFNSLLTKSALVDLV